MNRLPLRITPLLACAAMATAADEKPRPPRSGIAAPETDIGFRLTPFATIYSPPSER